MLLRQMISHIHSNAVRASEDTKNATTVHIRHSPEETALANQRFGINEATKCVKKRKGECASNIFIWCQKIEAIGARLRAAACDFYEGSIDVRKN